MMIRDTEKLAGKISSSNEPRPVGWSLPRARWSSVLTNDGRDLAEPRLC